MTSPNVPTIAREEPVSNSDQQAVSNERMKRLAGLGAQAPPPPKAPAARAKAQARENPGDIGVIAADSEVTVKALQLHNGLLLIAQNSTGGLAMTFVQTPAVT